MNKHKIFRVMHAINVVGAGVPGFIIVAFPSVAAQHVLWPGQEPATMGIVGSIWLAIGATSFLGLFRPYQFLGIFLVQFVYKSLWLATVFLPYLLAGKALPPGMLVVAIIFLLLLVEFGLFVRPKDFRAISGPVPT